LAYHKYTDTFSSYFLIGLNDIFPTNYSKHNKVFYQLAKWDCGDYNPTPILTTYQYDAESLVTKSTNIYQTVEFLYE
jgi:hypothetical protein